MLIDQTSFNELISVLQRIEIVAFSAQGARGSSDGEEDEHLGKTAVRAGLFRFG